MKLRRLFFLPILLLILAACGTVTTPAAPTATAAATDAGALPQSASVQDMLGGELSIQYPLGWSNKGDGEAIRVLLATSADLLDNTNTGLKAGQIQMAVSATPNDLAKANVAAGAELTPKTFLEGALTAVKTLSPNLTLGAVTDTTINGNPAARVTGSSTDEDALIIAISSSEAYLLVVATTAKGDLTNQDALITSIAASADYVKAAE